MATDIGAKVVEINDNYFILTVTGHGLAILSGLANASGKKLADFMEGIMVQITCTTVGLDHAKGMMRSKSSSPSAYTARFGFNDRDSSLKMYKFMTGPDKQKGLDIIMTLK